MENKEKRTVISRDNMPVSSPITTGILWYLLLDKTHSPQWVYGAVGVLYLIIVANIIYHWVDDKEINIFKKMKDEAK
jgi:hypothetical protein